MEQSKTVRDQLRQIGRDVTTIASVVTILGTIVWFLARPYIQPFADLPRQVAQMQSDVAQLRIQMTDSLDPRLLDFMGHGVIVEKDKRFKPGNRMNLLYLLRRNASCDASIRFTFVNIETTAPFAVPTPALSVKADVGSNFSLFKIPVKIPSDLPPGRYVYKPIITPINCGVYGEFTIPMSDPFEVLEVSGEQ